MNGSSIVLSKASPADFEEIVEVMKHYHFMLLSLRQAGVVDPNESDTFTVYNEVTHYDWERAYVARVDGRLAGCCHWRLNNPTEAKTTLIVVSPEFRGSGVGYLLQEARMKAAHEAGAKRLYTFCDTEKSTEWYKKHFGYRELGQEPDHHRLFYFDVDGRIVWGIHFGFPGHLTGTKLECDLDKYFIDRNAG